MRLYTNLNIYAYIGCMTGKWMKAVGYDQS